MGVGGRVVIDRQNPKISLLSPFFLTHFYEKPSQIRQLKTYEICGLDIDAIMTTVGQKLRGYLNYYGVQGNSESLNKFFEQCKKLLFRWLNRRSHKRSYTWKEFTELLRKYAIPNPTITEPRYQPTLF